jgi:hypothetical protein
MRLTKQLLRAMEEALIFRQTGWRVGHVNELPCPLADYSRAQTWASEQLAARRKAMGEGE